MVIWRRKARERAATLWKWAVLAALRHPGCPACGVAVQERERFNYWFLMEMYHHPVLIPRMQAAYGLCPEHAAFLVAAKAGYRTAVMYEYLVEDALERIAAAEAALSGGGNRAGSRQRALAAARESLRPRDVCLGCEDERQGVEFFLSDLGAKISQPDVMALYQRSPGLCLPHFLQAAPLLAAAVVEWLARGLLQRLEGPERRALCGEPREAAKVPALVSTRLVEASGGEGCPLCRVAAEDLGRFFSFFAKEGWHDGETLQALREGLGFCAKHMRTLAAAASPEVVSTVSAEVDDAAVACLRQFLCASGAAPGGPVARLLWRRHLRVIRDRLAGRGCCLACQRVAETEEAMAAEFVRALETEAVARRYEGGPGLCMRHFVAALACEAAMPLRVLLRAQRERLLPLLRDLREYLRKYGYHYRDEPRGAEQDAWLRALERFTGRAPEDGIGHRP